MNKPLVVLACLLYSGVSCPAQRPTVPAASVAAPVSVRAGYVIGATDVLTITVWKEPAFSETIPVRPDGMVSIALLGDLQAAGLTPMELTAVVTHKLKQYIQDPRVSVVVKEVNSQRIFLLGEVMHAGPLSLTPGMTALQAISSAGGLTQFANGKKIYILRNEDGKPKKIGLNYRDALKGDLKQNLVLKSGDTIVVPS
jgi:polysaccharide export outer membrane protein